MKKSYHIVCTFFDFEHVGNLACIYNTQFYFIRYIDPSYETRDSDFYVPRDEAFAEIKDIQFNTTTASSGVKTILESLDTILTDINLGFDSFEDMDELYKQGFPLPSSLGSNNLTLLQKAIPRLIKVANDSQNLLRFDTPEALKSKKIYDYMI